MGRGLYGRRLQQRRSRSGSNLSGDEPDLKKTDAEYVLPGTGYGAQGGTAEDLKYCFNEDGLGAIVNSSRGIIAAYKQEKYAKFGAEHFGEASRQAVIDMVSDINSVL